MKKLYSGFTPILILLIVLAFGVVGYFGYKNSLKSQTSQISTTTPTSFNVTNDFSNWKTYTNSKYGYTFKYPSIWEAEVNDGSRELLESASTVYLVVAKESQVSKAVIEFENVKFDLNHLKNSASIEGADFNSPKPITLGQNTFYYYEINGGNVHYNDKYFYNLNGKLLSIIFEDSFKVEDELTAKHLHENQAQILSTFKFLDNQSASQYEITQKDNGKNFNYSQTSRFWFNLDPVKYPLSNIGISCNPKTAGMGYVSNLSVNGPDNYPIGYETTGKGSCIFKNGNFSVTINID